MASDLTPKQEFFCQRYIELGNASEAYRQSYDAGAMKPETVNRSAKELMDNPKIAARLDALRELHLKRHLVTIDSITQELEEARRLAIDTEQPSAAVSASLGKAKVNGLITDKTQLSAEVALAAKVTIYMPDNGRDERPPADGD